MKAEDRLRIKKEAETFANEYPPESVDGVYDGYVAGATAEHERLIELRFEVAKYIFAWDLFFGSPKVGQPPSLEHLRELLKSE